MTFPMIVDSATYTSSSDETFRFTVPNDVELGDILHVYYAGDGTHTGFEITTGDLQGWNLYACQTSGSTVNGGMLFKIANGDEAGQTLICGVSPSEKWCVAVDVIRGTELYRRGNTQRQNGSGANPNPSSLATSDVDFLVMLALAGDGSGAITAQPSGYTFEHNLNNGAADGVALGVASLPTNGTPIDPGAWTRASAAWCMLHYHWPTPNLQPRPIIIRRDGETLSGVTKDYTVTIPDGPSRRFFAAIHAASSAISSVVLDPGGLALTLSRVTDGTNNAETSTSGSSRAATIYTPDNPAALPIGTYTLRVSSSVTTDVGCASITVIYADQGVQVHDVVSGTSSVVVDSPDNTLLISTVVQPLSAMPSADFIWGTQTGLAQVSTWSNPHYMSLFGRRRIGATTTMTYSGVSSQSITAFSLRYSDSFNPYFFGGF